MAEELRKLAAPGCIRYAEEFYEEIREIVAVDLDGSFEGVANSLADLIDRPTCEVKAERQACGPFGDCIEDLSFYELSCGHVVAQYKRPSYCPECGAEVVEDAV